MSGKKIAEIHNCYLVILFGVGIVFHLAKNGYNRQSWESYRSRGVWHDCKAFKHVRKQSLWFREGACLPVYRRSRNEEVKMDNKWSQFTLLGYVAKVETNNCCLTRIFPTWLGLGSNNRFSDLKSIFIWMFRYRLIKSQDRSFFYFFILICIFPWMREVSPLVSRGQPLVPHATRSIFNNAPG